MLPEVWEYLFPEQDKILKISHKHWEIVTALNSVKQIQKRPISPRINATKLLLFSGKTAENLK